MKILLDTNVLLRLVVPEHPMNRATRKGVNDLAERGYQLVVVPQVLYEYWVVSSRPTDQNGLGLTVQESGAAIQQLISTFQLLRDERGIFDFWKTLVVEASVAGKKAHDARLVAAMLRHGVQHILTYNKPDFIRYAFITAHAPHDAE